VCDDREIVKQFDYAPFGAVIPLLGDVNRTKFIGKEKDKESNYADHGVRKYDDEIGRFTSIDLF
jgi:RHS repeat-associated protein